MSHTIGGPGGTRPPRSPTSTSNTSSTSTPSRTSTSSTSTADKKDESADAFDASSADKAAGYLKKVADKTSKVGSARSAARSARAASLRGSGRASSDSRYLQNLDNLSARDKRVADAAGKVGKGAAAARVATTGVAAGRDIAQAVRTGDAKDIAQAGSSTLDAAGAGAAAYDKFAKGNTALGRRLGVVSGAADVVRTGEAVGKAADSIGQAMKTGSREDIENATYDTADAVRTGAYGADGIKRTVDKFQEFRKVDGAVKAAAEKASGTIGKEAAEAAANEARDAALKGSDRVATRKGAGKVAGDVARKTTDLGGKAKSQLGKTARKAGKGIGEAAFDATKRAGSEAVEKAAKEASEKAAKEVLKRAGSEVGEKALKQAAKAGAKAGAKVAAKSAGRFVPGVNIAIAAADTVKAGVSVSKAVQDPSFENVKNAAFDSVTAAGSVLAATNIPVVSQAGAAVSAVSDIAKSIW